jgi:hypothetical protein
MNYRVNKITNGERGMRGIKVVQEPTSAEMQGIGLELFKN